MGYDRDQILVLTPRGGVRSGLEAFKNELRSNPSVISVASSSCLPNNVTSSTDADWPGRPEHARIPIYLIDADYDLPELYGLELVRGPELLARLPRRRRGGLSHQRGGAEGLGLGRPRRPRIRPQGARVGGAQGQDRRGAQGLPHALPAPRHHAPLYLPRPGPGEPRLGQAEGRGHPGRPGLRPARLGEVRAGVSLRIPVLRRHLRPGLPDRAAPGVDVRRLRRAGRPHRLPGTAGPGRLHGRAEDQGDRHTQGAWGPRRRGHRAAARGTS
ncbi:MAG: hypothetical protein MZV70_70670 [Desulfobacterales bacterium]|nr:hypothetical protein [Desulfobacterales bacterium]